MCLGAFFITYLLELWCRCLLLWISDAKSTVSGILNAKHTQGLHIRQWKNSQRCVCVCCSRCSQCALRETSEEIRGDKQSPLFSFCRSFCLFYSLSVSPSPGVSLWLPVSCREETNDGSMSAQSAVTETSLNLSFPPSHPVQLLSPCLSPPTHAFPFFHHYIYPSASSIHSVPAVIFLQRPPHVCLWGDDYIRLVWLRTPASHFPHFPG